jgi:GTP-binding protein YchF
MFNLKQISVSRAFICECSKRFSISIGLVGYPNVGKSTFFNALAKRQTAEARNLPFCTIEPNITKVQAVDEYLLELSELSKNTNIKAYQIEIMDVAGLIKGSMGAKQPGVQFLHCLRSSTAIIQILRCFKNPEITYMDSVINPLNELEVVQTEFMLSDIEVIDKKLGKGSKKLTNEERGFLEHLKKCLDSGKTIRNLKIKENLSENEKKLLDSMNLISSKPFIYLLNVDPPHINNDLTKKVEEYLNENEYMKTSVLLENEGWQLAEDMPLGDGLKTTKSYFETYPEFEFTSLKLLQKIIKQLNYVSFYSIASSGINQSWLIKKGSNIVEAAGLIHSDFAKNFICAEICRIEDWRKYKDEEALKSNLKRVGKDYIVQDGDIVSIKFRK